MFSRVIISVGLTAALVTGTGAVAASAAPRGSVSNYAGQITTASGYWCTGVLPNGNPQNRKPVSGSAVTWLPCDTAGYYTNWLIQVVSTQTGDVAEIRSAANNQLCWSSSRRGRNVSLRNCLSASDPVHILVHQIGLKNDWALELDGLWFTSQYPLTKISQALWLKSRAIVVQFPHSSDHAE